MFLYQFTIPFAYYEVADARRFGVRARFNSHGSYPYSVHHGRSQCYIHSSICQPSLAHAYSHVETRTNGRFVNANFAARPMVDMVPVVSVAITRALPLRDAIIRAALHGRMRINARDVIDA